ncbi:MAG TPA: hypothetical protein VL326_23805 [Kofleriaceae bacterium]|nr:hypothetical protein [Kofleriaceae bacterium]
MENAIELLRKHSNCDDPIAITELGTSNARQSCRGKVPVEQTEQVMEFMVENQGVCVWGIRLDAGDDPPVVVAVDPDFQWRPQADAFSTFINCQAWDHAKVFGGILLGAQVLSVGPKQLREDIELLRREFRERPSTYGWPGRQAFRFERGEDRVLIWEAVHQADWWISSETEDGLAAVTHELWACSDLSSSLYGLEERGERVLEMLRKPQ